MRARQALREKWAAAAQDRSAVLLEARRRRIIGDNR